MDPIPAAAVYVSGAATTVCCVSCSATSTSGSWRKGWPLPDGRRHVNLCNRCGQRWQKAGRPVGLAGLQEAEERKAWEGGSATASQAAGIKRPAPASPAVTLPLWPAADASKRLRPAALAPGAAAAVRLPFRRRQGIASDEDDSSPSPTSSSNTPTPGSLGRSAATAPLSLQSSLAPRQASALQTRPLQAAAHSPQQQAAVAAADGRRFVSYCIQNLRGGRANHAAFWLQDEAGESLLAVVGTDARLSGHFTYYTTPGFMQLRLAPALRCTNRAEVQTWLAGFGLTNCVPDSAVRLPELSVEERKRLFNPEEPVWERPAALKGTSWQGVREESGRMVDGRHVKRFILLGAGGREKLVVTGVDSDRQDRRYKYYAEGDMGGFAFENAREVMAWINHALERPASAPLEAEQVRIPRPVKEVELGSLMASLSAAAQQAQQARQAAPPLPPRPASVGAAARGAAPASKLAGAAAGAAAAAGGSLAGSPYAGSVAGKVRPAQSYQLAPQGGQREAYPSRASSGDAPGSQAAQPSSSAPLPQLAPVQTAPAKRPPTVPRMGLRCASCGLTEHSTADCPLAVVSPPALIHTGGPGSRRTLSLLLGDKLPSPGGSGGSPGDQLPPSLQLMTDEQFKAQLQGASGSGTVAGSIGHPEAGGGSKPITPDHSFSCYPALLNFVATAPSPASVATLSRYAQKLASHITDLPPPLPGSEEETLLCGWTWTATSEALRILQELAGMQVSLSLLESTGISSAVAQLRTHSNRDVAAAAEGIVRRWRTCAVAALEHATASIQRRTGSP